MSLLMKALEKAAKDRGESRPDAKPATEPAPAAAVPELSLEPVHAPAAPDAADSGLSVEPAPQRQRASTRATAAPATEQQARAATVMQAAARSTASTAVASGSSRSRMWVVIGGLAGIAAIGFGTYVYLQITNPAMFLPKPPASAPGPLANAPAPAQPAPPRAQPQIATSTIVQPAPAEPEQAASAAQPAPVSQTSAAPAQKPAPAPSPGSPDNRIVVSRGSAEPKLNPLLNEAYAALESGRLDVARRQYEQLLRADPRSIDAMLGLAAIATQENRSDEASRHYVRILELDPRHALAQTGLISLIGRADPLSAESRLKQLIGRDPSPFLYFTLGNLYADQSQWSQAQHAYFQAHHLEPANPDYAYNLAIGLEHLGQSKLALGFYQRAVQLAAARGRANFNVPQAQDRINRLAAQVE